MQPISREAFLHNLGYGAMALSINGNLALAPLVNPGTLPPHAKTSGRYDSVDAQAQALLEWYHIPGIAIGLVRDNKMVYAKGFGVQSIATRRPMTEYSQMAVGSFAKMFTGAAIWQLIEAGRITLEDTFVQHVPWFHMADPRYNKIRIRHLLAHTSGLPATSEGTFYSQYYHGWQDEEAAERLVSGLDDGTMLANDPDDDSAAFCYSDIGYSILAALIHDVTGESFEAYQRRHILDPLQMYNTTFLMREVKPQELVAPHVRDLDGSPMVWDRYPYTRELAPAACLFSNIVDMCHWLMACMNGGVYFNRVLKRETVERMWSSIYRGPCGWPGTGYNSGFFIVNFAPTRDDSERMLIVLGGMPGVHTHATLFPERGIAAVVYTNLRASWHDPCFSWGICDKLAMQMLYGDL